MKERETEINERVRKAFTENVPFVLDQILSECDQQKNRKETMMQMQTDFKPKKNLFKWASGIAAALVVIVMSVFGVYTYQTNYRVDSVVALDVNPSIEIETNRKEKVLAVNALNEDGKKIIGDMDFKGSDMDVTVNALIGSMLRNGYLSDISNSILVSVYGEDDEKTAALQERLSKKIDEILQTDSFSGAVLSQTVRPDDELRSLADTYGISLGKARLIREVIRNNPEHSFADLTGLTINELNLMSKTDGIASEDVQSVGDASDKAYIGADRAKEIAFSHAGVVSANDVSKLEIEMDYEHGVMIYEIEFHYGDREYEYDIHAVTGDILKSENEPVKENVQPPIDPGTSQTGDPQNPGTRISVDEAKQIAFAHAGVTSANDVSELETDTDDDDGVMIYEIEFHYGNYEYHYDIQADTGKILKSEKEPDDTNVQPPIDPGTRISADQAKQIAFAHAGVSSENDVSKLKIETDNDDGVTVYELKFVCGNYEYHYDIHAGNGKILESEKEPIDDDDDDDDVSQTGVKLISAVEAQQIAFAHAGVTAESDVSCLVVEADEENGIVIYELEFIYGNYEYSYDIVGTTGEILKSEKEPA